MTTQRNIFELIKNTQNDELFSLLQEKPQLAQQCNAHGLSAVMYAVYCKNAFALQYLLATFPTLNLHEAAAIGNIELVKKYIQENPSLLDTFSQDGFTALGLACFCEHEEVAAFLIKEGADVNLSSQNSFKVTPLHSACSKASFTIAKMLLEAGANPNATQAYNVTPLHSAAHRGHNLLTQLLLEAGANPLAAMDNGKTPLLIAEELNLAETVQLIESFIQNKTKINLEN